MILYALLYEEHDREGLHTYSDVIELFQNKETAFRIQFEMTARQSDFERLDQPWTVIPWKVRTDELYASNSRTR